VIVANRGRRAMTLRIDCVLTDVHYRVHKSLQILPILSQIAAYIHVNDISYKTSVKWYWRNGFALAAVANERKAKHSENRMCWCAQKTPGRGVGSGLWHDVPLVRVTEHRSGRPEMGWSSVPMWPLNISSSFFRLTIEVQSSLHARLREPRILRT
jgi:hypothetical protein